MTLQQRDAINRFVDAWRAGRSVHKRSRVVRDLKKAGVDRLVFHAGVIYLRGLESERSPDNPISLAAFPQRDRIDFYSGPALIAIHMRESEDETRAREDVATLREERIDVATIGDTITEVSIVLRRKKP